MSVPSLKPRIAQLAAKRIGVIALSAGTPRKHDRQHAQRRARWMSAHPLCAHCERAGRVEQADELDHVVPLHLGGADDEANYQSLCVACHKAKTAREAARRGASHL